ncbi:MAG: transporter [Muribaculaceae bacterium]|nr:transporter [Muribaculaceae bacterium]
MKFFATVVAMSACFSAFAGGILTNTNQSVNFLRNPARDAAIGIDGVYSNPAGVAFMPDGLHLSFNWQYAMQTREITGDNPLFALGAKNNGQTEKKFKGIANAPFIPSIQAAYNKGHWSFQFNFSVTGGGGKCEFDQGVGSFETVVGAIAGKMMGVSSALNQELAPLGASVPGVTGYDVDAYMKGKQYYFGIQLGAAYKINKNISVYGGLRMLYGIGAYEARLNNIRIMNGTEGMTLPVYFEGITQGLMDARGTLAANGQAITDGINSYVAGYMAAGYTKEQAMQMPEVVALQQKGAEVQAAAGRLQATADQLAASGEILAPYSNGVNLKSDQKGFGIAPVLGVDFKIGAFNFAAKYDFKVRMRMKNDSDLPAATVISATNKFVNGTSVPEDAPALLTLGAQWSIRPDLRLNLGYHHFFDTSAHWYDHSERLLSGGTNEYLAGLEWDINRKFQISGGAQVTRYPLTDAYMNDMSFVVNSWTFGLGIGYQVTKNVKINAAYFQTNYSHYKMNTPEQNMESLSLTIPAGTNDYYRTNKVLGLGVDLTF